MLFPLKDYNPTKKAAVITFSLIGLNILVFIYFSFFQVVPVRISKIVTPLGYSNYLYGFIPREITRLKNMNPELSYGMIDRFGNIVKVKTIAIPRKTSPFLTLVLAMFMHGSLWHLGGNMLFLWIFGNNIEDYLGKSRFIFFYLTGGIGASLIHAVFNWNSPIPVVGASGAVSAIMGAYLILYPAARVKTLVILFFFITFVDIPAAVFLIVWFIFQFLNTGGDSQIAWLAHVGGFLLGVVLIKVLKGKIPVINRL